ncbi:MAG: hypothetical protein ABIT01_13315 [Thermoanaerobaculia bacterium]
MTSSAVISGLVDQLNDYQRSEYACRENAFALLNLEQAQHWLRARADERARRGVLGTSRP